MSIGCQEKFRSYEHWMPRKVEVIWALGANKLRSYGHWVPRKIEVIRTLGAKKG